MLGIKFSGALNNRLEPEGVLSDEVEEGLTGKVAGAHERVNNS
jgi:hypothetical protein